MHPEPHSGRIVYLLAQHENAGIILRQWEQLAFQKGLFQPNLSVV